MVASMVNRCAGTDDFRVERTPICAAILPASRPSTTLGGVKRRRGRRYAQVRGTALHLCYGDSTVQPGIPDEQQDSA